MPYKDKKKQKEAQHDWYIANKEIQLKRIRAHKKAQLKRMGKFASDYKAEKGCCKCPENDPVCLDFHHTGDDKIMAVSSGIARGWGQKKVQAEIDKCIVICANCHRKLHASEAYQVKHSALNRKSCQFESD